MAKNRLSMRHINEILRLKHEKNLSVREIARSCGVPASTVGDYLKRAQAASLEWPLPEPLSEQELLDRLMGSDGSGDEAKLSQEGSRQLPDWAKVHRELRRKGVTLRLLWQEYRQDHPEGYGRSQFCHLHRQQYEDSGSVLKNQISSALSSLSCFLGRQIRSCFAHPESWPQAF